MTNQPEPRESYSPSPLPVYRANTSSQIVRKPPTAPPTLIEKWVVWEMNFCINTNGIRFGTESLHDILKPALETQDVPVDIFFAPDARWIVAGARGIKIDQDRRQRVVATLRNSIYTDMQFIAGIDYFGNTNNWANIQMMLIVQPEEVSEPQRPIKPEEPNAKPLIPREALFLLIFVSVLLFFAAGDVGKMFGFFGGIVTILLYVGSNPQVKSDKEKYQKALNRYEEEQANYAIKKEKIAIEREERAKNRLSRSFKTDDLRVFHTVMTRSIAAIVHQEILAKGASIKESVETNNASSAIPNTKDIFDDF